MRLWTILYSYNGTKSYERVEARTRREAKRRFLNLLDGRWNVEILDVWS
jgi:hypothetical protein